MSYGLKYNCNFASKVFHKEYEIRVFKKDYTGTILKRGITTDGATLSKDSANWIKGTSLKFTMRPKIEGELKELYTENRNEFKVQLLLDGTIIWQGFILSEQYQEEYTYKAPVTITASDGIGLLKDIEFHSGSSFQNQLATIQDCLKNTGLDLPFSIAVDLTEENFDATKAPLIECYDNPKVRENAKLDCYKVLEDILCRYDAELTQLDSKWHIIRSCDKLADRKIYSPQGQYIKTEKAKKILKITTLGMGDLHCIGTLDMSMTKAMKSAKIEEDLAMNDSLLPPMIANDGEYAKGWYYSTGAKYKPTDDGYFKIMFNTEDALKTYIKTTIPIKATTSNLLFTFKFGLIGVSVSKVIVEFIYRFSNGNKKWLTKRGWENSRAFIESEDFQSSPEASITFYDMKILANNMDQDGSIEVRFYGGKGKLIIIPGVHDYHGLNVVWAVFKEVYVTIIRDNKRFPSGYTYHFTVNENATGQERTSKYLTGDAPDVPNVPVIYQGYTSNKNGVPTKAWIDPKLPNKYPLSEILGKMITSRNRKAKITLKGDIRGNDFSYSRIIQHQQTLFEVASVSLSLYNDMASVKLIELLPFENRSLDFIRSETKESTSSNQNNNRGRNDGFNNGVLPKLPFEIDKDNYIVTSKGKTKAVFADDAHSLDGNEIDYFATDAALKNHANSNTIHTSADEKQKWNKAHSWIEQNTSNDKAKKAELSDNSLKFDGKTPNQFIRKDVNQEVHAQTEWKDLLTALNGFKAGANGHTYVSCLNDVIQLLRPLISSSFTSGFAGEGIKIDFTNSSMELDNLLVRKSTTMHEILIQKLRAIEGMLIITPASMKVSDVTEGFFYWKCSFDNNKGQIANPFVVNDLVRLQTFGTSARYLWAKVTSIGSNYIHLSKTNQDGQSAPQVGDDLVLLGNSTIVERQNAIILSSAGNANPVIDIYSGIDQFSLDGKLQQRMGNLKGILDPHFGPLQGYGLFGKNVYLKGRFSLNNGDDVGTVLSSKASSSELTTEVGKINTKINQVKLTLESSITQTNNRIALKVSKTYVDGQINDIQNVGINLVTNSQYGKWTDEYGFCIRSFKAEAGQHYTLSFEGKIDQTAKDNGKVLRAYIYDNNDWGWAIYTNINTLEQTKASCTIMSRITGDLYITFYLYPRGGTTKGKVYLERFKVEKGKKATDWTPALSDQVYTKTIISEINQSAEEIKISASKIQIDGSTTFAPGYNPTDKIGLNKLDRTIIDGGKIKTDLIKTREITALGKIVAGSFYLGNNKFIVDNDGNLTSTSGTIGGWKISNRTLQTANWDDPYNPSHVWTDFGGRVLLDALGGFIKMKGSTEQTRNQITQLSYQGILANFAGYNCISTATGLDYKAAVVGIGNNNYPRKKLNNFDYKKIIGVYGRGENTGTAPGYGGFFEGGGAYCSRVIHGSIVAKNINGIDSNGWLTKDWVTIDITDVGYLSLGATQNFGNIRLTGGVHGQQLTIFNKNKYKPIYIKNNAMLGKATQQISGGVSITFIYDNTPTHPTQSYGSGQDGVWVPIAGYSPNDWS